MRFAILTFGCRTNQADSFALDRDLRGQGGLEASVESADVVVVNTCAVTAAAEQAARQAIRRVARLNPSARIVATGCYATRAPADVARLPVAHVVPNDEKPAALTGLSPCSAGPAAPRETRPAKSAVAQDVTRARAPMPGPGTHGRTLHLLRVQTGCNERCTYCIVPAARGSSRSLSLDDAVGDVQAAAGAGFRQTTITGVHLGCYGRDLFPPVTLAGLVRRLRAGTTGMLFRLSAIEPMDFDDDLLGTVADRGCVAPHFHLPLQHASDRVLEAMGRPYTLDRYRALVDRLLRLLPGVAIGTDVIVGFPGETDADFERCERYLTMSGLAYVHVFPFSPRPGTPASRFDGRPPGDMVRQRIHRLRAIGSDISRQFRSRWVGSVVEGLTLEDGTLVLTDNYLRVKIPPGLQRNERVKVRIVSDGEPMTGIVEPGD